MTLIIKKEIVELKRYTFPKITEKREHKLYVERKLFNPVNFDYVE